MSSDQTREWEDFQNKVIPAFIDRLNDLEEQKSDLDVKKKDIIEEMAERAEKFMPADEVSRFLKLRLKGIVKEDTIEDALGIKHKRKYASLPTTSKPESPVIDHKKTIEVSSSGSQSVTGPNGNEKEQETELAERVAEDIYTNTVSAANPIGESDGNDIAERSAEIALNTIDILKKELKEKDIRISEAFHLVGERDKRIHELQMQMGEIELQLGNLKKNPPPKNVDEREELQIKYDELKVAYDELKQVEILRTQKQDFKTASKITSPLTAWVAAVNISGFSRALVQLSMRLTPSASRGKIVFDVTEEGQLKNPRPEGT